METITIQEIEDCINHYLEKYPTIASKFRLKSVPQPIRGYIALYLPEDKIDLWLQDEGAFGGRSGLELISELDRVKAEDGLKKIYDTIDEALSFATTPIVSFETLFKSLREAQYKQLLGLGI